MWVCLNMGIQSSTKEISWGFNGIYLTNNMILGIWKVWICPGDMGKNGVQIDEKI